MSREIRDMFGAIAPGYDRANQILSFGIHHRWRKRTVCLSGIRSGQSVCDCATGTGDLALAFKKTVGDAGLVVGVDFAQEMIEEAQAKSRQLGVTIDYRVADIAELPFDDHSFDVASIGFGIRNVDDPLGALREMARVVRPGGRVVVLEFGQPDGAIFGPLYRWYSGRVIPTIGGWLTGQPAPYAYLTRSAAHFPAGSEFVDVMNRADCFTTVHAVPLTFQIAYVYVGVVS